MRDLNSTMVSAAITIGGNPFQSLKSGKKNTLEHQCTTSILYIVKHFVLVCILWKDAESFSRRASTVGYCSYFGISPKDWCFTNACKSNGQQSSVPSELPESIIADCCFANLPFEDSQ